MQSLAGMTIDKGLQARPTLAQRQADVLAQSCLKNGFMRFNRKRMAARKHLYLTRHLVPLNFAKMAVMRTLLIIGTGDIVDEALVEAIGERGVGITTVYPYSMHHKSALNQKFVEAFKAAATTQFGSGWAWLVADSALYTVNLETGAATKAGDITGAPAAIKRLVSNPCACIAAINPARRSVPVSAAQPAAWSVPTVAAVPKPPLAAPWAQRAATW